MDSRYSTIDIDGRTLAFGWDDVLLLQDSIALSVLHPSSQEPRSLQSSGMHSWLSYRWPRRWLHSQANAHTSSLTAFCVH